MGEEGRISGGREMRGMGDLYGMKKGREGRNISFCMGRERLKGDEGKEERKIGK